MNGIVYPYGSSHLICANPVHLTIQNGMDKAQFPGDNEVNASTLIQLSGGIDSTFVLWHWLVNNPDEYCLVHHINLKHFEKRSDYEQKSVYRILEWLDKQGLKNYFYVENTFDYGNFTSVIPDVEVCGFHAGILLRSPRWHSIKRVLLPIYKPNTDREGMRRDLMRMISNGNPLYPLREFVIEYPLQDAEKIDVIASMPRDLVDLCWWCRTPYKGEQCGNCFTCKEVNECIEEITMNTFLNFLNSAENKKRDN